MPLLLRLFGSLTLIALGYALGHLAAAPAEFVPAERQAGFAQRVRAMPVHEPLLQVLLEPEPLQRAAKTAQVLLTTSPDLATSVVATAERVALAPGDVETGLLAEWLTGADPQLAIEWANGHPWANHPWVFAAVVRTWTRLDPESAVKMIGHLPARMADSGALISLVLGWDEGGHPGLEDYMLGIEQGETQQQAITALVRRKLLRDGPEATIRWAESLPDDRPRVVANFKRNAMRRTASALVDLDPERAMQWAESFGESTYGRGVYRRIAVRLALRDGERALRWLRALPAGEQRDSAVREAFRTFTIHDGEDALAWLEAQPDEPWLDPAYQFYAEKLGATVGAEAGLEWAKKIDSRFIRKKTLKAIGVSWHRRAPDEARAWAESPPDWVDADILEVFRDPEEYKRRNHEIRKQRRAEYEARRAARLAGEDPGTDAD